MKKYYIAAAVLVPVLAIALYFLLSGTSDVYKAIPRSAVAVIEVSDWAQFKDKLNTTYTGGELKKTSAVNRLLEQLKTVESLYSSDKVLAEAVQSGTMVVSVHLASASDFDFLYTTPLKGINDNALLNRLQTMPDVKSVQVRIFKQQKVMEIVLRNGRQITLANLKGILSFSYTSFITESAITAMLTGDCLSKEKSFVQMRNELPKSKDPEIRLFFDFSKSDVILPVAINPAKSGLFADWQKLAGWSALKIIPDNDNLLISGIASPTTPLNASPVNLPQLLSLIPDNAALLNIGLIDTALLVKNQMAAQYFTPWAGNTRAFVTLESFNENFSDQNLLVIPTNSSSKAQIALKNLLVADGSPTTAVDTFMNHEIFSMPNGAVLNTVFGNSFTTFGQAWFTVTDNAAFFCNNMNVLKFTLEKLKRGENMSKTIPVSDAITGNAQLVHMHPSRCREMMHALLPNNSTLQPFIEQFSDITLGMAPENDFLRIRMLMKTGGTKTASSTLWKTRLKTAPLSSPQIITSNNTQEIFVQDTSMNIYLINNSGDVLFTRQVSGAVLGKVQRLDYYKNGSYQYIFNTTSHVYVIDHTGSDVASYPLRLSSPATTGLTLTAEGLSNNYRYFVPCANGGIYGYQSNGKPLPGWSPKAGVGNIPTPLYYSSFNGKAHLAALNSDGMLSMFEMSGNMVWSASNLQASTEKSVLIGWNNEFRYLGISGREMTEIDKTGNDKSSLLVDEAEYLTAVSANDTGYLYYIAGNSDVRCYNQRGKFAASAGLKGNTVTGIQTIITGKDTLLAITDATAGKIFVYTTALERVAELQFPESGLFTIANLFNTAPVFISVSSEGVVTCSRMSK